MSIVTDRQTTQNRSAEGRNTYKGKNSTEEKRKTAREEDAWTIVT
jgi:hypothetical protein